MAVFQRGNRWHYEFMHCGQQYRKTCGKGCKTRTRALKIEADARGKAMQGEAPSGRRKILTLAEAAELFLAEKDAAHKAGNLAWNTVRHYRNAWDAWLSPTQLANLLVNQIKLSHIEGVAFPGGDFTTKNARQALGAILGWCKGKGIIGSVPRPKGKRLQGRKIRITPEIEDALRQHMERDVADIFTVMLDAVMRNCEVFAMSWGNINWELAKYFIPGSKTPAGRREIPLSDRAIAMLRRRQADAKGPWVFPSRIKSKGHRVTVAKQFREARAAAGIDPTVKLYCARHTGASELSEMGVDLLTLRDLLGHEDISTTNNYLHGNTERAREAINQRNAKRSGIKLIEKSA